MKVPRQPTDRAVSPVIGVILLVAITVLLAATAATYFVGFTDETDSAGAPTAAFEFDPAFSDGGNDTVTIEHESGDSVEPERVDVVVSGASCAGGGDPNGRYSVADDFNRSDAMTAGTSIEFRNSLPGVGSPLCGSGLDVSGATFKIVWEAPSETSRELMRWTAP